jgi:hypothetical protein
LADAVAGDHFARCRRQAARIWRDSRGASPCIPTYLGVSGPGDIPADIPAGSSSLGHFHAATRAATRAAAADADAAAAADPVSSFRCIA